MPSKPTTYPEVLYNNKNISYSCRYYMEKKFR